MLKKRVVVVGGGAAGVFGAIRLKELNPNVEVIILEKTLKLLAKVKISGGGRCNVTHHQFNPKELIKNYPRGSKELLGPFHFFQPQDMVNWLEAKEVKLKTEEDGRIFPTSDSSQTIIDCFLKEIKQYGIQILFETEMLDLQKNKNDTLQVQTNRDSIQADAILLATGSHPKNFEILKNLNIPTVDLVPSLFTFHLPNSFLNQLSGTVFKSGELKILGSDYSQIGPILVTHFGLSGPCTLKLSAFAARFLKDKAYQVTLSLNVDSNTSFIEKAKYLLNQKRIEPYKQLSSLPPFSLTKNAFIAILEQNEINPLEKWGKIADQKLEKLARFCHEMPLEMNGKSTYKEEFVTAGGVELKHINLKTMEHKQYPRVFFAGEVLDIDGITGGFNFQNAWTTATIAADGMQKYLNQNDETSCEF